MAIDTGGIVALGKKIHGHRCVEQIHVRSDFGPCNTCICSARTLYIEIDVWLDDRTDDRSFFQFGISPIVYPKFSLHRDGRPTRHWPQKKTLVKQYLGIGLYDRTGQLFS